MRYPVRCLRCSQRQLVSFTLAGISLASHVRPAAQSAAPLQQKVARQKAAAADSVPRARTLQKPIHPAWIAQSDNDATTIHSPIPCSSGRTPTSRSVVRVIPVPIRNSTTVKRGSPQLRQRRKQLSSMPAHTPERSSPASPPRKSIR